MSKRKTTSGQLRADITALRHEAGEADPIGAAIFSVAAMVGEVAYQLAVKNERTAEADWNAEAEARIQVQRRINTYGV